MPGPFDMHRQAVPQQVFDTMQGVAELRVEVKQLRTAIAQVLLAQVQGRPIALHEDPIRSFLGLPANATPEEALERLVRSQARVIGKITCGKCGAAVQDLEGVKTERCPFCGEALATVR